MWTRRTCLAWALVAAGCGAASPGTGAPPVTADGASVRSEVQAESTRRGSASTRPSDTPLTFDERVQRAREAHGDALVAARVGGVDGAHLVLEASRCYRLEILGDGRVHASLHDEHGHLVADGGGARVRLGPLCPRWTGSFELEVTGATRAALLLSRADPPD